MYCWQSVFQRTAWQVDNLFPLDSPSYTVYIMLRCRRKVVVVFISLTFLALLLLLLYSLTSIIERRYVCVTSWALASASLILRLYERGKHESLGLLWGIFPHLFPCTSLVWLWYGVDQGYKAHLASSPGHSQILSRSHGCEIKSGSGLGTRLRLTIPTSFGIKLLHIPLRNIHERYVVMPRESLYMQTDTHCLFHCIVLCGVWSPWQQKRRMKRKKASRSTASTSSVATVSH